MKKTNWIHGYYGNQNIYYKKKDSHGMKGEMSNRLGFF